MNSSKCDKISTSPFSMVEMAVVVRQRRFFWYFFCRIKFCMTEARVSYGRSVLEEVWKERFHNVWSEAIPFDFCILKNPYIKWGTGLYLRFGTNLTLINEPSDLLKGCNTSNKHFSGQDVCRTRCFAWGPVVSGTRERLIHDLGLFVSDAEMMTLSTFFYSFVWGD